MNKSFTIMLLSIIVCLHSCTYSKQKNTNRFEIKTKDKTWSLENLNVSTFKNGVPIPEAKTKEDWLKAGLNKKPVWCYFNNNESSGKLYNWYAVNNPNGLAPEGWHIPTDEEWSQIVSHFGGEMSAAKNMKIATDGKISFSGIRDSNGVFSSHTSAWWSKTESDFDNGLRRFSYSDRDFLLRSIHLKTEGLSVICVKD